jgi:starch synthase (maltosyl-transferring)
VGRIDRQKGVSVLLDALEEVEEVQPQLHLVVAGDGPELDGLQVRAGQSYGLAGRVHWLGRRDDVPALLAAADFLVLPSLWEGMPNVVLEAMAARRAVVATLVEGSEELVVSKGPDRTGWLVAPGDAFQLATALRQVVEQRDRLRALGEAGRARVEAQFDQRRVIAAYQYLWAGILGFAENGVDSAAGR